MSAFHKIRSTFDKLLNRKDVELPAFLGNLTGTVKADDNGNVYAVLMTGEVVTVRNQRVPNVPRLPVILGYDKSDPTLFQVLRSRNAYSDKSFSDIIDHAVNHQWPNHDALYVRGEQILPGLVLPSSGMVVQFYGFVYYLSGWHLIPSQSIDLSASVPTTGAKWGLVEVDTAQAISVSLGSVFDNRELLEYEDIPAPTSGKKPLFAVKLYAGQSTIILDKNDADVVDLRWAGYSSGGEAAYDLAAAIHAATSKATPVDADELPLWDSVASALKKLTWSNLKATLKTYFDTLYQAAGSYLTDAPSDNVYYGRRNAAWTNLKTYFDTVYAALANGVTNGDSHDHSGGDGAQIDHGGTAGLGDDDHTQYLLATGLREWTEQGSDPSTPGANKWKLYFKAGGLYQIDDAGVVTGPFGTGSGGGGDLYNYLINGGFVYAQRQAPATLTTITDNKYSADRWRITRENADLQYQRNDATGETGLTCLYYGRFKKITNAGKFLVCQIAEGVNSVPLRGKTVIFQAKMKTDSARTFRMAILELQTGGTMDTIPSSIVSAWNADTTDPTFGTNVAIITAAQSKSVTTSWANYSVSVTIPSNSKNVICAIWSDSDVAANGTLDVAEAGLYISATAQDWKPRLAETELALCQRFFEKTYEPDTAPGTNDTTKFFQSFSAAAASNSTGQWVYPYKVQKRGLPTLTYYTPAGTSGSMNYYQFSPAVGPASGSVTTNVTMTNYVAAYMAASGLTAGATLQLSGHVTADSEL